MSNHSETLELALRGAAKFLDSLDSRSIVQESPELHQRLAKPLNRESLPPEQVIRELLDDAETGLLGNASGRFFGWVIGGALPAALAADWLTSVWDQAATLHASGRSAAIVEEVAGKWLKHILGIPESASFAFCTGCQMAHATCLAAARNWTLSQCGWDVEERGLSGSPVIRVLTGDQHHGSVERAVRLLGLGLGNVVRLPTDSKGQVTASGLAAALEYSPAIVILQAGDINTGVCDPLTELIPIAHRHGAWVHIDGAFGLWAAASPSYRGLVAGSELADSWATDGHKWLNVPFDCGYAFVGRPEPHRAAMSHRAAYLSHGSEHRDAFDWTPEWSRRARAFPTYAALRQLGSQGVTDLIDRCCRYATELTDRIGKLPGVEPLWTPILNQGLVRFLDPAGLDHDRHTDQVIAAIVRNGEAFFSGTLWRGMRAMRVSVCNWRTRDEDIDRTVRAVELALIESRA